MALTRAQLLAGNDNDGVVLPNQPQGVIAGTGITISNTGVISVDSSTITGLVRLNNPLGFNSYVWPQVIGTTGQFLQLSNSTGALTWADAKGFAVVTVQPQPAPTPPDEGELWFDCSTGTLKIYQTCVAPGGWTDVNQSGLPVDPTQTTSSIPWAGSGTIASPYVMSVTTVGAGSSVFVVNTVTVAGLVPYQYVPIVDLNAVANGGRFSFSNYYADAGGSLTFQTIFTDQPPSPPTTTYTANIRVGYATAYINAVVNVVTPLTLPAGTITGTPTVGTAVSYTPGVASGGTGGYTYTYEWFRDGVSIAAPSASPAYTPVAADVGKILSVKQVVTDSSTATANATTAASNATIYAPISGWTPTGSMASIPGGLSGTYTGPGTTMTASGCIEVSINGGGYGAGGPVSSGQVVAIRWKSTSTCGGAATPTVIQGYLTDGVGRNDYSVTVTRVPAPPIGDISDTNVPLNAAVSEGIGVNIQGLTTTAYVTYDASSTGTAIGASLTPGGPFTLLATSGQGFPITNTQTLYIEQTVGSGLGVGYTAVIRIGDGTNAAGTYDEFVYTATTTSSPAFPNTVFGPSASDPNATPDTVSIATDPQLGALEGTAVTDASGWQDGNLVSLTATNMLLSVNGAPFASTATVNVGDSLAVAWDPTYISGIADGTPVTGSFSSAPYTNSYGYTVDKDPAFALPAPPPDPAATNAPLGGTVATGILTVDEYNSPIDVTISSVTTGTAIDLDNVAYEIGTSGQVPVASLPHTFTLNPGETVQFFGDTGTATLQEYGYTVTMGAAPAQEWLVETVNATPSIGTPTIDLPLPNATGVNPGLNSPSKIVIEGSAYDPQNGAGAQTSGIFELYKDGLPTSVQSTNQPTVVATVTPAVGAEVGGGYFAGQIQVPASTGTIYNLIVAPAPTGQFLGNTLQYKTSNTGDTNPNSQNQVYGKLATDQFNDISHPMFQWAKSLTIGGFNDWYIPAKNELEILYYNFKPDITTNSGPGFGINPNAVPPRLSAYTSFVPLQTSLSLFQTGGAQAFGTGRFYYSATEDTSLTAAATQIFTNGGQQTQGKDSGGSARAIRRVDSSIPLIQTLTIAAADTDGFGVGQKVKGSSSGATGVITAISGTSVTITLSSGAFTTSDYIQGNGTAVSGSPYATTTPVPPTKPSADVAGANLSVSTNYYVRARYSTTTPSNIDSNYSAWSKFTTASVFSPPPPGTAFGGGYFAGQILVGVGQDDGVNPLVPTLYNLIVAPISSGSLAGQISGTNVRYKTSSTADVGAVNFVYGGNITNSFRNSAVHPVFNAFINGAGGPNGPSAGGFNLAGGGSGGGTGIGGYNDWYLPAANELAILYFFLKPDSTANSGFGSNPNSVAPYTPNTPYGVGFPDPLNTPAIFQTGGGEAFSTVQSYVTASENTTNNISPPTAGLCRGQSFLNGAQFRADKDNSGGAFGWARAIRRVLA